VRELKIIGLVVVAFAGLALVGSGLYVISRIEDKLLANLVVVLVVAVALAIAAVGIGFGGALWRKAGNPPRPERHVIKETRIVDGRPPAPPQIVQASPMMGPVLPGLLRAAFAAGVHQQQRQLPGRDEGNEPIGPGWGDVWDGQIIEEEVEEER